MYIIHADIVTFDVNKGIANARKFALEILIQLTIYFRLNLTQKIFLILN